MFFFDLFNMNLRYRLERITSIYFVSAKNDFCHLTLGPEENYKQNAEVFMCQFTLESEISST